MHDQVAQMNGMHEIVCSQRVELVVSPFFLFSSFFYFFFFFLSRFLGFNFSYGSERKKLLPDETITVVRSTQ